jgi:solute carrier family 6 amino acid transporter-like protein 5/7/9/14
MTPDWTLMQEGGIWIDAASQIFYSFGVCFGGLIAFSSYNAMNENLIKNGLIVAGFNCGTSVFGK